MAETVRRLKVNRRYEASACGWCGDALALGEDGAVCEACETPHHARCWDKENGCNGDPLCVNRPLQQIPEPPPKSEEGKRRLAPGESICPSCGDIIDGFCMRCTQSSSTSFGFVEYTGPKERAEEAVTALKYAIAGLCCCGFILGPLAIVKGAEAKRRIAKDPQLEGETMATVAQVIGAIELLLFICYVLGNLSRR